MRQVNQGFFYTAVSIKGIAVKYVTIEKKWLAHCSTKVAPKLVGCFLLRRLPNGTVLRGKIVETEAYKESDPACHAHSGITARNKVLFGPAGHAYVYFIYGMYHCINVVTGKEGQGEGVLIRAVELDGSKTKEDFRRAAGPGKICRVMEIDLTARGLPYHPSSSIWLERPEKNEKKEIVQTSRVGISQATHLKWRWYLKDSLAVSKK